MTPVKQQDLLAELTVVVELPSDKVQDFMVLDMASGESFVVCDDGELVNAAMVGPVSELNQVITMLMCRKAYVSDLEDGGVRVNELNFVANLLEGWRKRM